MIIFNKEEYEYIYKDFYKIVHVEEIENGEIKGIVKDLLSGFRRDTLKNIARYVEEQFDCFPISIHEDDEMDNKEFVECVEDALSLYTYKFLDLDAEDLEDINPMLAHIYAAIYENDFCG
ncbi:hypothetical protein [Clostridium felsineum]|uniref:Uncharacterized protein n=1 Tax=Clostridium felsineum TaxID=36839 RepID=A0A1S8M2D5_9CLOT|nr:hypothetical protein [Clostridium felsineum]URZ06787.1 hypothetical protein CLROS_021200 [Clostridium felsineum]URZ11819.1 hypothetical protein CROST_025360 [Clostridium felsineum]